jgi:hypothetical protein
MRPSDVDPDVLDSCTVQVAKVSVDELDQISTRTLCWAQAHATNKNHSKEPPKAPQFAVSFLLILELGPGSNLGMRQIA